MRQGIPSAPPEIPPSAIGSADLCCALGEQRLSEDRPDDALPYFRRAVKLDPSSVHGWFGQGISYAEMKEYAASFEYYRKAIELDPALAIAHHNLGRSLHETGQSDLAYQRFQKALALGFERTRREVAIFVPGCPSASNKTVLDERRKYADSLPKLTGGRLQSGTSERDRGKSRLKIGYVSAFFHKDNWMKPVWGLLDQHDDKKFEVHLFSDRTELTLEIRKHIPGDDRFHDISDLSNEAAAALVARLGMDILVDLNGYSYPQRFPLFMNRPAPLVAGWFNMYATTGFGCFDYLIGDGCVIPPDEERWYCEKIARVAGSYLTFSVAYDVPPLSEPPCIQNGFVTFGSLISQYKITPGVIDAWCRILDASTGSRLQLRNVFLDKSSNRQFLRSEFRSRGVADERVLLEGPAPHYEFLQTYDRIDIALDAFPYNGGTTTTEAIWQGVPVIAFRGDRWVSRTSATLLENAGLGEWVADDAAGYVDIATQLAREPEKLATMRRSMRDRLLKSAVCDTASFARSMEDLYREIWES